MVFVAASQFSHDGQIGPGTIEPPMPTSVGWSAAVPR
jgi:hypothetical protein